MFVLYNILQLLFLVVFFPLISLFVLVSPKYRDRIPARLGFGLKRTVAQNVKNTRTFWLHALSVGEVTSALPLLTGLRQEFPESRIVVSVTTRTGKTLATELLVEIADDIIDAPLDLLPTISAFSQRIRPDMYIQVETDFWPNILNYLHQKGIPSILVNGRVSEISMAKYSKFRFFFSPMFQKFSFLCLQTEIDRASMERLGIAPEKLLTPGNLKFDAQQVQSDQPITSCANLLPEERIILIAGSTHDGEEEILIESYKKIRMDYPDLFLVIAPRSPARTTEITKIAENHGMSTSLRSENKVSGGDLLIVDTIGELTLFYSLSDIAFVGGSLVNAGGHNPIEPAAVGIPVLFGPNMQDFNEIAADLIHAGGAKSVADQREFEIAITVLLKSKDERLRQGKAALQNIQGHQGVVRFHLDLIRKLL